MLDFFKTIPTIESTILGALIASVGFFVKTLIDLFSESKKRKYAFKSEYWKEKLQACMKASEFYYEQLTFFELIIQKMDLQLSEKGIELSLSESLKRSIDRVSERISNPKNFEHHHINIFYNFDSEELKNKNREFINECQNFYITRGDNPKSPVDYVGMVESYKRIKKIAEDISSIYRNYLSDIRYDLSKLD